MTKTKNKTENRNSNSGKITTIIAIVTCLLGIATGVFNGYVYFNNRKINSYEYQYFVTLKEKIGGLQSAIERINEKLMVSINLPTYELDINDDIKTLSEIRDSDQYRQIIKLVDKHQQIEFITKLSILIDHNDRVSKNELAHCVRILSDIVFDDNFVNRVNNYNYKNILNRSDERIIIDTTIFKSEDSLLYASLIIQDTIPYYSSLDSFQPFVDYLVTIKHVDDPNVLFLYGIMENDKDCVAQAIDSNANLNVTDLDLVAKYSSEYEEYYIKHYNDKENNVIEPNEFVKEKRERFFDWNDFIKITNVIQLIAVLLLVVIVILYINNIKKKFESFSISNAENLYKFQMKLEEEAEHQHKTQEEFRDFKTTLVKYIENSFDEIWTMEEKESKTENELIKEEEKVKSEDFSEPKIKNSLSPDLSKNEGIKYYVFYYPKEGLQKHKTESKVCLVLRQLGEELYKKTELIKIETDKSKQNDNITKEKILENYYDIKILFDEWLQNYIEDKETRGVKNHFDDKENLSFINEYYKPSKGHNLQEDYIKRKHAAAFISYLLKKEIDYYYDDSQLKFHILSGRIKDYIICYNHLEDIQIIYEKVKNMTYQFSMKYDDFEKKKELNIQFEELLQSLSKIKKGTTFRRFDKDALSYINEFYKQIEEASFMRKADLEKSNINIKDYIDGNDSSQKEDFVKLKYQLLLQDLLEKEIDSALDDLWKEIQEIIERIKDYIKDDKHLEDIRIIYEKINAMTDQFADNSNSLEESKFDENLEEVR